MDITQLRQQIDCVDRSIVELFVQRMEISGQIADYKKEHDLPVFDPIREQEKLKDVAAQVTPELESSARVLYSLLFELSRSYQSAKNAACTPLFRQISEALEQTPKLLPAQARIACVHGLDERVQSVLERNLRAPIPLFFTDAQAVFSAVESRLCQYGLLYAEPSETYDLLRKHGFYVVRAFRLQDKDGAVRRLLLFGRDLEIYPGADKTSLLLTLPNRPGSLYRVLARLYTLGLNVARLDSRPCPGDEFHMQFLFRLETSVYAQQFIHLMCELDDLCTDFQYLGSYCEVI